jgi:hypothetical protein
VVGRRIGGGGGHVGRVGRHLVEQAELGGQRLGDVVHDGAQAVAEAVARGIALRQLGQRRLQFDADDRALRHAPCQAEPDGADPRAEVEHPLGRTRMDRSRQQDGIDGDAVTPPRLQQAHAASQQGVFGQSGFHASC